MDSLNLITYEKKNDKYVLCKEGVYLSLTLPQVLQMKRLCIRILRDELEDAKKESEALSE